MQKYKNRVALHITRQKDQKMVYKKYIKRGDKVFGPYYYSSYREGNKVKATYFRVREKYQSETKKRKLFAIAAAFLVMVVLFFFLKPSIIGLATKEPSFTLSPIQSHPKGGENWTVRLNTKGTADLTIKAVKGTTWSDINEDNQLRFLEIRCGNQILGYQWVNNSIFIENYNCDETGYETSKVLIAGKHTLEFRFGDDVKYAYNSVVPNKFIIQNSTGYKVAYFDDFGNIVLEGNCTYGGACTAPADSFIIKNSAGETVAYVGPDGNLCIETGDCSDQNASCTPANDAFIVKNNTDSIMSYIDITGELCLRSSYIWQSMMLSYD